MIANQALAFSNSLELKRLKDLVQLQESSQNGVSWGLRTTEIVTKKKEF